jgi:hypothetical protein
MELWQKQYGRFEFALVKTRTGGTDVGFDDHFRNSPDWITFRRTPTATLYLSWDEWLRFLATSKEWDQWIDSHRRERSGH